MVKGIFVAIMCFCASVQAQVAGKYDQFEIAKNDLIWRNTYRHEGKQDSLRMAIVQLLKGKFFTFNVIRNEQGYNGELKHYKVDCKKYGRSYINTPKMYWEGEWSGKFTVDVRDHSYTVIVYALYYESTRPSSGYYKTQQEVKGRFIDAVTKKNRTVFQKRELTNISLMGLSLKDEFGLVGVR